MLYSNGRIIGGLGVSAHLVQGSHRSRNVFRRWPGSTRLADRPDDILYPIVCLRRKVVDVLTQEGGRGVDVG